MITVGLVEVVVAVVVAELVVDSLVTVLAGAALVTVVTVCCGVDCNAPVCCASARRR